MAIASPPPKQPPIEALLLDHERLVRLLRVGLEALHERRLTTPQFTGEADISELIRYWDDVFEWIKQQDGDELVLMKRR